MTSPRSDRCILCAVVDGGQRLRDKLGAPEAARLAERCLKRVRMAVAAFDGLMLPGSAETVAAEFSSADAGAAAACQMQQRVRELPPAGGLPMALRVGLHVGPVSAADADGGETARLAMRMAELARDGRILVTGETVQALPVLARETIREIDRIALAGRGTPLRICEILWLEDGERSPIDTLPLSGLAGRSRISLSIRHATDERSIAPGWDALTLGRDANCDIVIADKMASRMHARIERRGDRVVLVDQSTNGTWLRRADGSEHPLRREESDLDGSVSLSFGHPSRADGEVVAFTIHRS